MRATLAALLLSAFMPTAPAFSDPNPQLVRSIEVRLAHYGLQADVSRFATSTVARLHLALSSSEGYLRKRRELRNILRNAKYK